MAKPKVLLSELSYPGPHEVLHGNLALVGLPGVVFTPQAGRGLPGVAFGHGWMQPPLRYRGLLRHLASWGLVVAAPATEGGPMPSHRSFANDLSSTLGLLTAVRLGPTGISVDPERLGLAGHSTGGGSAVLAAASATPPVRAVATVAPAQTMPPASEAARSVQAPGLHLAVDGDTVAPSTGHAMAIAQAWSGPVQLRTLQKSSHLGVTEGFHWTQLVQHGKPHRATQRLVYALFTAFLLAELAGESKYRALLESDVKHAPITLRREPANAK